MANTAAKKLTYDSKPIQVESAIRDGTGKIITDTYQTVLIAGDNIEITSTVDVPYGYTQLSFIESTGTQNINTGVAVDNNNSFVLDVTPKSVATEGYLISQGYNSLRATSSMYSWYSRNYHYQAGISVGTRCLIECGYNYMKKDGTNITGTSDSDNASGTYVYLFSRNDDSMFAQAKVHNFKIYDSTSTLIFNGVPAKRNSDGVIGLYDTVSLTFKTNAGSGDFVGGTEVPRNDTISAIDFLPLSGGTLTGSLTLTGTNGITSNNIVFNDWKLGVARNASGKLYRYVGLDTNSTTGWLKTRSEADVITDLGIDQKAPIASPTFTGTVTAAQVLTFSNTSNPYISIKSGSNTYYIQAYDNKLGIGPSWSNSMKIDSSGNVSLTGTPTAPDPGSNPVTTSQIATKNYVDDSIEALPEPMLFKGTLGTGGTITSLPTAAAGNEGWVYKVITDGTYASQAAKIGDLFICANTSTTSTPSYAWTYVPSGDDSASGVTNVATGVGLTGGPITTSGTIKAKLKSETNATYGSETISNMSGRQYAVVPDNPNGYLSVNVPWTDQYVFQNVENSADVDFSVLFTASTTGQTNTGPTHISGGLTYNPSTFTVSAGHFYNFYTNSSLDFIVGSTFQLTEVD